MRNMQFIQKASITDGESLAATILHLFMCNYMHVDTDAAKSNLTRRCDILQFQSPGATPRFSASATARPAIGTSC